MNNKKAFTSFQFLLLIFLLSSCSDKKDDISTSKNYGIFKFELQVILPGTPEKIYDLATGDISAWWDHSFSEKPSKIFIEAKPGGGFWEIFDEKNGDGALHATVIFAQRGKMLRFEGPLGLSGKAVNMVTTYRFEQIGDDSTRFTVQVHASGEIEPGTDETVKNVWHHFVFEQFKPFVASQTNN